LEPSLPCHANYYRWTKLQEPILGDSGHPIYCPVTRPTQGLSITNGNNTTTYRWKQGESPFIQLLDPADIDNSFQYIKDERVDLDMYQLQDYMEDISHNTI
jgi:hypothetical protein